MTTKITEAYWEQAGHAGYISAQFFSSVVGEHVTRRAWQFGGEIGRALGLDATSHILDLGCGDGSLSNSFLSKHYRSIDGYDLSTSAIARANKLAAHNGMRFEVCDITKIDYSHMHKYDGAYLWSILHHVKGATPEILGGLRKITNNVVVLEPNGNNFVRKLLEQTTAYKAAGEESFRKDELEQLFERAGYYPVVWKRLNLFPDLTPEWMFKIFKPVEPLIERTRVLRALCTANIWGFKTYR
jgi:2-polyprenyl-3-methyl-5-hydroxy-6-metoxy-1,4-benzoquinol methylase